MCRFMVRILAAYDCDHDWAWDSVPPAFLSAMLQYEQDASRWYGNDSTLARRLREVIVLVDAGFTCDSPYAKWNYGSEGDDGPVRLWSAAEVKNRKKLFQFTHDDVLYQFGGRTLRHPELGPASRRAAEEEREEDEFHDNRLRGVS
jgi:hypothetical protein